jgi:predicted  nucleic acid-binding Zn-ribbon protein
MNGHDVEEGLGRKKASDPSRDEVEARLDRLDTIVARWVPPEGGPSADEVNDHYREVGKLKSRLEATRKRIERIREAREDWQLERDDLERAITELEEAVADAAPRFQ